MGFNRVNANLAGSLCLFIDLKILDKANVLL